MPRQWSIANSRLVDSRTVHLRRLARYLRIRRWSRLRRLELLDEIRWKLDPWQDTGMY